MDRIMSVMLKKRDTYAENKQKRIVKIKNKINDETNQAR